MRRTRRGGPRTPSKTTAAGIDSAIVENALVFVALKIGRAQTDIDSVSVQTWCDADFGAFACCESGVCDSFRTLRTFWKLNEECHRF